MMRYRKLDENGDMSFGHRLADFWIDVPDAPAQAVKTRLMLWTGEWYLQPTAGTPWKTEVLGKHTAQFRDLILRARITGTEKVLSILQYYSTVDRDTRHFAVGVEIDTEYGATILEGPL